MDSEAEFLVGMATGIALLETAQEALRKAKDVLPFFDLGNGSSRYENPSYAMSEDCVGDFIELDDMCRSLEVLVHSQRTRLGRNLEARK